MRSLFIGRYQPFHDGDKAIIDSVLSEGRSVLIAVRDTPGSKNDRHAASETVNHIRLIYRGSENVEVIPIPDIGEICYGRYVGWGIRRVRLHKQLQEVGMPEKRNSHKRVIWLTGRVGCGKTSLAYLLKERLNAVVLDGDEMRHSISPDLGFSKKDRETHNLRVARLAQTLLNQNMPVVVSVIAPHRSARDKITQLIDPYWIYVKGGKRATKKMPYEPPKQPHLTIDSKTTDLRETSKP
jgi:adenylylsulfate kinase-like enzyme